MKETPRVARGFDNGELLQIVPNRASDRAKYAIVLIGDIANSITYIFSVCP
jgi:hypothetical protein